MAWIRTARQGLRVSCIVGQFSLFLAGNMRLHMGSHKNVLSTSLILMKYLINKPWLISQSGMQIFYVCVESNKNVVVIAFPFLIRWEVLLTSLNTPSVIAYTFTILPNHGLLYQWVPFLSLEQGYGKQKRWWGWERQLQRNSVSATRNKIKTHATWDAW